MERNKNVDLVLKMDDACLNVFTCPLLSVFRVACHFILTQVQPVEFRLLWLGIESWPCPMHKTYWAMWLSDEWWYKIHIFTLSANRKLYRQNQKPFLRFSTFFSTVSFFINKFNHKSSRTKSGVVKIFKTWLGINEVSG